MSEWLLARRPRKSELEFPSYRWRFFGDLELSLVLRGYPDEPPHLSFARKLRHPSLVPCFVKESEVQYALKSIQEKGVYIDVFWENGSLEDLEEYFKEHRLLLPEGLKEKYHLLDRSTEPDA